MSLGTILIIILIIFLLGGFSGRFGGYGYGFGHTGIGVGGILAACASKPEEIYASGSPAVDAWPGRKLRWRAVMLARELLFHARAIGKRRQD